MAKVTPSAPAEFAIMGLDLSSEQVKPGQAVTITVDVTNLGGVEDSYTLNLSINGRVEQTEIVTLAPGVAETVTFTITKGEPSSYSVCIGAWTDKFIVTVPWLSRYWGTIVIAGLLVYLLALRRKRARPAVAE